VADLRRCSRATISSQTPSIAFRNQLAQECLTGSRARLLLSPGSVVEDIGTAIPSLSAVKSTLPWPAMNVQSVLIAAL
jgi:hypothetical protein